MKKNYDSEFCGSLPLSFINQIQPYGYLVVIDKEQWQVLQVSQNLEGLFNVEVDDLLEKPVSQFISNEQLSSIQNKVKNSTGNHKFPTRLSLQVSGTQKDFLCMVHPGEECLLLELELLPETSESFLTIYQEIKYAVDSLTHTDSLNELNEVVLRELKRTSGFDRIMIYKFDEDWNGEVIAEVLEPGMDPYLGLRFPASDIPKQARELYLKNPYRLIPDRDYTSVKLLPVINPLTNTFTNLSDCNVRGVATVHLEYLKNMNVGASMSTRILKGDALWGLISCHHRTAKFLNFEQCSVFEMLSNVISTKLAAINTKEAAAEATALQTTYTNLLEQVFVTTDIMEGLSTGPVTLLNVLDCSGAAILYRKGIKTLGDTPSEPQIRSLAFWLQKEVGNGVFVETALESVYEEAATFAGTACGIIVLPLHKEKGEFIIGFRPEVVETVSWGGNPDEAINFEPDKKKYHPRNSFKQWQQTLEGTALSWNEQQLQIAEKLRAFVIEFMLKTTSVTD